MDPKFFRKYADIITEAEQSTDEGVMDTIRGAVSKVSSAAKGMISGEKSADDLRQIYDARLHNDPALAKKSSTGYFQQEVDSVLKANGRRASDIPTDEELQQAWATLSKKYGGVGKMDKKSGGGNDMTGAW